MFPSLPLCGRHVMMATLSLVLVLRAQSATHYVSTTGVSSGTGTSAAPWNLKWAMSGAGGVLAAGDIVYLRGGIYATNQRYSVSVSGTAALPITFREASGESAVIDGSFAGPALPDDGGSYGLIEFNGAAYISLADLEIRNFRTTKSSDAVGVLIVGTSHHITLSACDIHHIETNVFGGGNANGIGVYGTNATTALTNVTISGCDVHHLKTGYSESVTFNGNVDTFLVENSSIHDCDNIGIDCIGYEGVGGTTNDRARNGTIRGNVVFNIDSLTNPAYGGDRGADGIYVDGGTAITIERNKIFNCNIGIELASEHSGRATSNCKVRNNWVWRNHLGGLFLGGAESTNGGATGNSVTNNTFWQNDTDNTFSGEIVFQNFATSNSLKQNILLTSSQNLFVSNVTTNSTTGNTFNWNLYYSPSGANTSALGKWQWNNVVRQGFGSWKTITGFDGSSQVGDPKFVAAADPPDLHIQGTSAAIDTGDPAFAAASGETDIDNETRVVNTRVDIGADETSASSISGTYVNVYAVDPSASEDGDDGAFLVTRSGAVTGSTPVTLAISGNATRGTDYENISISLILVPGQSSATVRIRPLIDSASEGAEFVFFHIPPSSFYLQGNHSSDALVVYDSVADQWRATQFGAQASNPAIAGDSADPDNDGMANLLEFALGTVPMAAESVRRPVVSIQNGYLTLSASRDGKPAGVTLLGESSATTAGWLAGAGGVVILADSDSLFKVRDVAPVSENAGRFLRLRATRP